MIEPDAAPVDGIPEDAYPISLPVMAIEGMDTADGRYLEPGGISHRALPLSLLAQVRTPDGGRGHDNAYIVGAVTEMVRRPGPEVISRTTGEPFPEGTFVWSGRGWMYDNVPGVGKSAYQLVKDRALSGNSIDLSDVVAEAEYAPEDMDSPDAEPTRWRMRSGVIAATTLVAQPAFPDAYVELDGELMVPGGGQNLAASGVISWRSAELGDDCAACHAGVVLAREQDVPEGEAPAPRRDGMVALIPANAADLTVDGGDPEDQMHLTLAYLGDDVMSWTQEQRAAVHELGQQLAGLMPALQARAFAHAQFNPDGGPDGDKEPCAVYLVGDGAPVGEMRAALLDGLREKVGDASLPEQHEPFVPHVTAGYGLDVGALSYTGPLTFDRLRVALGGDVTDYPLGGGEALVAAALPVLPAAAFNVPEPDAYTPPSISEPDENGVRYYTGHVAKWNTCHVGMPGRCVVAPRSSTKYAHFHRGLVRTEQGDIPAGVITFNRREQTRGGHAGLGLSAVAAAAHYDNTATVAADVRIVDGKYGPWACGVVRGDLTAEDLHALRMSTPSGDWRRIRGRLDMVSVLHVNLPGFYEANRSLVASGEPMTLVAAAVPYPGYEGSTGPFESDYANPHVYARDVASGAGNCVCGSTPDDALHVELVPGVPNPNSNAGRNTGTDDDELAVASQSMTEALEEIARLTGITPQTVLFNAEVDLLVAVHGEELANWVSKAGGLPKYIKRIAEHLKKKGMDTSRAIATAINAAKKMCSTGDTNWPGSQQVNAGSRAEACSAVAEWEAKKAKS